MATQDITYDEAGEFVYTDTAEAAENFREGWDSLPTEVSAARLDDDAYIAELDEALRARPERDDD